MGYFGSGKDISVQEGMNMQYKGIIITGTSGAGQSTTALKLCEKHSIFLIVQAVTTRESRKDDMFEQYKYITEENFKKLDENRRLLIKSEYRGKYYGITHEALQQVIDNGKTPLLILTPQSVGELEAKKIVDNIFFTIFLDASDDILDERLTQRGEQINNDTKKQREKEREYAKNCLYSVKNDNDNNIVDIVQLIYSLWEYRNSGGMVPKKLIELMIKCDMLLRNTDINKVNGASYDLSLGDQYWQDRKKKALNNNNPFITLDPGDYVIVSSKEIARFPKDIAGRFDLTVSLFCRGVILSNGPQVDPGFEGALFCLLFNTSNGTISLKRGDHYATIEFIKLLEPTIPYSGQYQGRVDIIDYLPTPSAPSVIVQMKKDIEKIKSAKWLEKSLPLILSILSIISAITMAVILYTLNR
jgi:guanylate kinase/deoxycytidine triphosphate deaminase